MVHVSKCAIHGSYEYWILTPYRVVTFSKQRGKKRKKHPHGLGRAFVFETKGCFFFFEVVTFETFLGEQLQFINGQQDVNIYRIY